MVDSRKVEETKEKKINQIKTPDSLTLCIKRVTQAQKFLRQSKFSSSYGTHRYARWANNVARKLFTAEIHSLIWLWFVSERDELFAVGSW